MTVNDFIAKKFTARAQVIMDELNVLESEMTDAQLRKDAERLHYLEAKFEGYAHALQLLGFDYHWNVWTAEWELVVPENASEAFGL